MRTTLMKLMLLGFLTFGPVTLLPARAVEPDEVLADPKLEARARELSHELRCLVCQNQSIDDSNAPLARDLRLLVRERLQAGDSDAAVKSFLVARYGDFVLLKPPFDRSTLVLWGTPAVLLLLTIGVLLARLGGRGHGLDARQPPPLTADEQKKLDRLLDDAR